MGFRAMNRFVIPINSPEVTPSLAGVKATILAQLIRAGLPVPPGFVISTAAYDAFVEANALDSPIMAVQATIPTKDDSWVALDDPVALADASYAIREIFHRGSVPQIIVSAIREAYLDVFRSEITTPHVAIRSSATAEDLPDASFAGQYETYLHVCGEKMMLEALKHCWSSLWTARAMAYRIRQNIKPANISLAVLVQEMVYAEVSGVMFTVDPLTGNANQICISASWGLGESVVSGRVTPDTIFVEKATGKVQQMQIGNKMVMTIPTAKGTKGVPVPLQLRRQETLTPKQATELACLGREIEAKLAGPQDIEWAIAENRFHILQSRPVTGLPNRGMVHEAPLRG